MKPQGFYNAFLVIIVNIGMILQSPSIIINPVLYLVLCSVEVTKISMHSNRFNTYNLLSIMKYKVGAIILVVMAKS